MKKYLLLISLFLGLSSLASAVVMHIGHYGLGEPNTLTNDGSPINGLPGAPASTNFSLTNWIVNPTSTGVVAPGSTAFVQKDTSVDPDTFASGTARTSYGLSDNWAAQIWIRPNSQGTVQFLTDNNASTGAGIFFQNNGNVVLSTGAGSTTSLIDGGATYQEGVWERYTIIKHNGTLRFYIGDTVGGLQGAVANSNIELNDMLIGFGQGGTNGGLGAYDELNVWRFDGNTSLDLILGAIIPEPSIALLFAISLLGFMARRKRNA